MWVQVRKNKALEVFIIIKENNDKWLKSFLRLMEGRVWLKSEESQCWKIDSCSILDKCDVLECGCNLS